MNENQFEKYLDLFEEKNNEMISEFGQLGLVSMKQSVDRDEAFSAQRESPYMSRQPDWWDSPPEGAGMSASLVEELKAHTYKVSVTNFFNDLVMPMAEKLDDLQTNDHMFQNRLQYDSETYYGAIIRALRNLQDSNRSTFLSSIKANYDMFMRNPIWNTLLGAMRGVKWAVGQLSSKILMPILNTGWQALFGKPEDSVDVKILKAIKDQTAFMRTGESGGRGLWQRFREQGLIGMAARGAAGSALGGSEMAQRRQQQREAGLQTQGGLRGWLADQLYGDDVVKREPVKESAEDRQQKEKDKYEKDRLKTFKEAVQSIPDELRHHMAMSGLSNTFDNAKEQSKETLETSRQVFDNIHANVTSMVEEVRGYFAREVEEVNRAKEQILQENFKQTRLQDMASNDSIYRDFSNLAAVGGENFTEGMDNVSSTMGSGYKNTVNILKEVKEQNFDLISELRNINSHTKKSATENERIRKQGLLRMIGSGIMGAVRTVTSLVTSGLSSIGSALTTGLSAIAAAMGMKKFMGGKNRAMSGAGATAATAAASKGGGKFAGAGKMMGRIGVPLMIASTAMGVGSTFLNPDATKDDKIQATGEGGGTLAGGLAGAKLGAMAGSFLGPLGAAGGGLIGGGLGALGGSKLGGKIASWFTGDEGEQGKPGMDMFDIAKQKGSSALDKVKETGGNLVSGARDKVGGAWDSVTGFFGGGDEEEQTTTSPSQESRIDPSVVMLSRDIKSFVDSQKERNPTETGVLDSIKDFGNTIQRSITSLLDRDREKEEESPELLQLKERDGLVIGLQRENNESSNALLEKNDESNAYLKKMVDVLNDIKSLQNKGGAEELIDNSGIMNSVNAFMQGAN